MPSECTIIFTWHLTPWMTQSLLWTLCVQLERECWVFKCTITLFDPETLLMNEVKAAHTLHVLFTKKKDAMITWTLTVRKITRIMTWTFAGYILCNSSVTSATASATTSTLVVQCYFHYYCSKLQIWRVISNTTIFITLIISITGD